MQSLSMSTVQQPLQPGLGGRKAGQCNMELKRIVNNHIEIQAIQEMNHSINDGRNKETDQIGALKIFLGFILVLNSRSISGIRTNAHD